MAARPGTKQCNFYLEDRMNEEIEALFVTGKKLNRRYSRSHVVTDALTIYFKLVRLHKASKSVDSVYNFTVDAVEAALGRHK